MPTPPALFDDDLLALRRARAACLPGRADFLHLAVAREIAERLKEINRDFSRAAIVGPRADLWAESLAEAGVYLPERVADAPVLDLAPAAHDLVVHGLALHWANDPVGQLVQARRALVPDGLFLGALLGGETLSELRRAFAEAEVAVLGGLSPRVAPMGEIRDLGALLQRAGFALPVADSLRLDVEYTDAMALMRDLRAMGETNVLRDRLRRPMPRVLLERVCAVYAVRFGAPGGRVRATFEVIVLTGWAPSPDQPRPLRPGSAKARLADALGVAERPAGGGDSGRDTD